MEQNRESRNSPTHTQSNDYNKGTKTIQWQESPFQQMVAEYWVPA